MNNKRYVVQYYLYLALSEIKNEKKNIKNFSLKKKKTKKKHLFEKLKRSILHIYKPVSMQNSKIFQQFF